MLHRVAPRSSTRSIMCTISRIALDMAKRSFSESRTVGHPFDEARQIGHDKAPITRHLHDAQLRFQRGEGVVGDLQPFSERQAGLKACSCPH